ncbi:hypothetical protein CRUP_027579 [Coryphaenoides rupestris]|nr:hypothetical protein CRUP_027579 [Coryphaenoides rupestris]
MDCVTQLRTARKSEWLRSTLAHHHHHPGPGGVDNEIVVLATGIDQYLQEVFHHLSHHHHHHHHFGREEEEEEDTVSAEDFKALCSVLGLEEEVDGEEQRMRRRTTTVGDGDEEQEEEDDDDEFGWICGSGLPGQLSFKEFHSRLCGYFRVRAAASSDPAKEHGVQRLNFSVETELVEREIRLRCPRVRRRKCVTFDLPVGQTRALSKPMKDKAHTEGSDPGAEAAALRELVEDLRAALQGSDARCLSLEVALRRHSRAPNYSAVTPSSSTTASSKLRQDTSLSSKPPIDGRFGGKWVDKTKRAGAGAVVVRRRGADDPILRELRLIRASRDGQLEEAIHFNRRLEEELGWAYQEVRQRAGMESALRKENSAIRRRAEEAREAVKQGLQRVRLIQEQAQSVPELQSTISQLETQLHHYRSRCTCMTDSPPTGYHPLGAEDTCGRMGVAHVRVSVPDEPQHVEAEGQEAGAQQVPQRRQEPKNELQGVGHFLGGWLGSAKGRPLMCSAVEMPASSDRVMRSPRLAAMGVATLSGLMPTFRDARITPIMMRPGVKRSKRTRCASAPVQGEDTPPSAQPTLSIHTKPHLFLLLGASGLEDVPSSREAMKAVATLEAHSSTAWPSLK